MYSVIEPYYEIIFSKPSNIIWSYYFLSKKIFNLVHSDVLIAKETYHLLTNRKQNIFDKNELIKEVNNSQQKSRKLLSNEIAFKVNVVKELCNKDGVLDKGTIGSLVDMATCILSFAYDEKHRMGVSIEISSKFIEEVKEGMSMLVICKLNEIKNDVAYSSVDILDEKDLSYIATCTHTEFLKYEIDIESLNQLKGTKF